MLNATPLAIPEVLLFTPNIAADMRGDFAEVYNARDLAAAGVHDNFVVDNHVRNVAAGVLRGLHYQRAPLAQSKLLRVTRGSIWDVAVDIRPGSPTYGRHVGVTLTAASLQLLYVPEGFAHGFCVLEDGSEVHYKVNRYPEPSEAIGIRWDDPGLAIPWPLERAPILNQRDKDHPSFATFTSNRTA